MSIKIKLVSGKSYTSPDGRQFTAGVTYEAEDQDAMSLLGKRTEGGAPFFARVKDADAKKAEAKKTQVPEAKVDLDAVKDADKNGDISQFTISHADGSSPATGTVVEQDPEGTGEEGGETTDTETEGDETGGDEGKTVKTEAPAAEPGAGAKTETTSKKRGGVTINRKAVPRDDSGLIDTGAASVAAAEQEGDTTGAAAEVKAVTDDDDKDAVNV